MTTETTPATPAAAAPAAAATPAAAAPTTPTPAAAPSTPATASPSSTPPAAASKPADDDLVTGKEAKPAEKVAAEKPPETAAEKRAYLESKVEEKDKEALKGKTDAEVEEMFKAQKAKETEAAELGDFKIENVKVPEDMPIPEEVKGKVTELAKIFNNKELTASEKIQKAVDLHVEMNNASLEKFVEIKNGWKKAVQDSPELSKAVGPANDVVRKFAGNAKELEEFQGCLKMLGLGNHPAFVRFCANVAKATGDDSLGGDNKNTGGAKKDLAELMYPEMKSANAPA